MEEAGGTQTGPLTPPSPENIRIVNIDVGNIRQHNHEEKNNGTGGGNDDSGSVFTGKDIEISWDVKDTLDKELVDMQRENIPRIIRDGDGLPDPLKLLHLPHSEELSSIVAHHQINDSYFWSHSNPFDHDDACTIGDAGCINNFSNSGKPPSPASSLVPFWNRSASKQIEILKQDSVQPFGGDWHENDVEEYENAGVRLDSIAHETDESGSIDIDVTQSTLDGLQEEIDKKQKKKKQIYLFDEKHPNTPVFRWLILFPLIVNGILAVVQIIFCFTDSNDNDGRCEFARMDRLDYFINYAVINMFFGVLFRNEIFGKCLFDLIRCIKFKNIGIKYLIHRIAINSGGIHRGAGIAGVFWVLINCIINLFVLMDDNNEDYYNNKNNINIPGFKLKFKLFIDGIMLLLFMYLLATSSQKIRDFNHNIFAYGHRISLYLIFILFWCNCYYVNIDNGDVTASNGRIYLIALSLTTIALISPFFGIRKVIAKYELINKNMIQITLPFVGYSHLGSFVRISRYYNPAFSEWHSFGPTLNDTKTNSFSVLINNGGDWCAEMINDYHEHRCPKYIYFRKWQACTFVFFAQCYKSVLFVASGAGIAPVLAYYYLPKHHNTKLTTFWLASNPKTNYTTLLNALYSNGNTIIYDTKQHGRPDMAKTLKRVIKRTDIEAVFCIANPKVAHIVLTTCRKQNIPVYGSNWDR